MNSIFAGKDAKKLLAAAILILLCSAAAGQLTVGLMADDYKKEMIAHDYAVAGYLYRNGAPKTLTAAAFTAERTPGDVAAGQALLQMAGYDDSIDKALLPRVKRFQQKYAALVLAQSVVSLLAIVAVLLIFIVRWDRTLEKGMPQFWIYERPS